MAALPKLSDSLPVTKLIALALIVFDKMSRFWAAGSSSDSDEDSDDSSVYSSEDSGPKNQNRWVDMSDSSSEEENRVVKSGKERALETFAKHIKNLRQHMKDKDYYQIQCEFEDLSKAMVKNKQHLRTGVPRPLVRILCDLEDHNAECLKDKAQFKKLSARQGRALNKMKLTLKKHNKAYAVVMDAYRQNPIVSDDESSSSSGSSSSSSSSSSNSSSSGSSDSDSNSDSDSDSDSVSRNVCEW